MIENFVNEISSDVTNMFQKLLFDWNVPLHPYSMLHRDALFL